MKAPRWKPWSEQDAWLSNWLSPCKHLGGQQAEQDTTTPYVLCLGYRSSLKVRRGEGAVAMAGGGCAVDRQCWEVIFRVWQYLAISSPTTIPGSINPTDLASDPAPIQKSYMYSHSCTWWVFMASNLSMPLGWPFLCAGEHRLPCVCWTLGHQLVPLESVIWHAARGARDHQRQDQ